MTQSVADAVTSLRKIALSARWSEEGLSSFVYQKDADRSRWLIEKAGLGTDNATLCRRMFFVSFGPRRVVLSVVVVSLRSRQFFLRTQCTRRRSS